MLMLMMMLLYVLAALPPLLSFARCSKRVLLSSGGYESTSSRISRQTMPTQSTFGRRTATSADILYDVVQRTRLHRNLEEFESGNFACQRVQFFGLRT